MDWGSDSDIMEDWSSFGSKMLSGGSGDSWGISWYNSSVSIGGESSDRGDWGSSWDKDISIRVSFTLSKVVSIWPSSISVMDWGSDSNVLEDWSSLGGKMLSGSSSNSWSISWNYSSVSIGGESTNRGNWGSSEDMDSLVSIAFS